jgi:hypothetical protein
MRIALLHSSHGQVLSRAGIVSAGAVGREHRGHQEQMPYRLLPLSPQIWRAGNSTFLTTAEATTDVAIRCLGKSEVSMRLNKGMSINTVPKQCSV